MTDKSQIFKCHECGAELDESRDVIFWPKFEGKEIPLCEYCMERDKPKDCPLCHGKMFACEMCELIKKDDGFFTAFSDGEVCHGCVTNGAEPHADWCFAHLEPGLDIDSRKPKCPCCGQPMMLQGGCYWCDNKNCEQGG